MQKAAWRYGASRSASWISRRHSPGWNQALRDHCGRKLTAPSAEQPHGGVEMRQARAVSDDLLLQMAHDPAQLGPLPAQSVHDVRLGHRDPPSLNTTAQNSNRATAPGTRAARQVLQDTVQVRKVA